MQNSLLLFDLVEVVLVHKVAGTITQLLVLGESLEVCIEELKADG
jgi:hypothetical protein